MSKGKRWLGAIPLRLPASFFHLAPLGPNKVVLSILKHGRNLIVRSSSSFPTRGKSPLDLNSVLFRLTALTYLRSATVSIIERSCAGIASSSAQTRRQTAEGSPSKSLLFFGLRWLSGLPFGGRTVLLAIERLSQLLGVPSRMCSRGKLRNSSGQSALSC